MQLRDFLLRTDVTQAQFAGALGVSQGLVSQWIRGAMPPPIRCVQIEFLTDRKVSRLDLRPDDWAEIWPELAVALGSQSALPLPIDKVSLARGQLA